MTRRALLLAALLVLPMLGLPRATTAQANEPISDESLRRIAEERDSVRAWLELARRRAATAGPAAALDVLRPALDLAPNSEDVLGAWGRLSLAAGRPAQSLAALEPLARLHPAEGEYSYLLGVAWLQCGDLDGAVDNLRAAIALEPDRARPKIALGLAFNAQNRYEEARQVLEEALRLAPDEPEALAAYAEALEGIGALDPAERTARRALEGADHATAHLVLGLVAMERDEYAAARDSFLRAVEASDAQGSAPTKAHYQLSLAYARLGESELSDRHRRLYQDAQRATERRLLELRGQSPPGTNSEDDP